MRDIKIQLGASFIALWFLIILTFALGYLVGKYEYLMENFVRNVPC